MIPFLVIACAAAFAYQIVALIACVRQLLRRDPACADCPPVSILKAVHGLDPSFYEAIRSHAVQDYPHFELLFASSDPSDPCLEVIERLRADFPHIPIRILSVNHNAPNGKVGSLAEAARQAKYDILLVNDSDIRVPQGYLRKVIAPLANPQIGIVTCLYSADANHLPGIWEAIGIVTDFAPNALVAPMFGVKEFGLGSTLAFRRRDLDRIGGFDNLRDFIADDYQLAKRITQLGLRVHLSEVVVETVLQGDSWAGVWAHQLRWNRTIRVSRGAYIGLPLTFATLWAIAALLAHHYEWAIALLAIRMLVAFAGGLAILHSRLVTRFWFLVPFRDLWGMAVWTAGLFGDTVLWRDQRMRILPDGRVQRLAR